MSADEIAALSLTDVAAKIARRSIPESSAVLSCDESCGTQGSPLHVCAALRASSHPAGGPLAHGYMRSPRPSLPVVHQR